jgi:hypothetical protein
MTTLALEAYLNVLHCEEHTQIHTGILNATAQINMIRKQKKSSLNVCVYIYECTVFK